MSKPFGKPVHHGWSLTRGFRLTIALWVAALPAYFLCGFGVTAYPTLAERPFFWPATLGFSLLYGLSLALWLRRRPSPRAPGTSSRTGLFFSRFLLSMLIAFPAGLCSSILYGPALQVANAVGAPGGRTIEHALVDRMNSVWVLDSPYWEQGFRWEVKNPNGMPKDITEGSMAKITLRSGLLGARWIESIEYTVLR